MYIQSFTRLVSVSTMTLDACPPRSNSGVTKEASVCAPCLNVYPSVKTLALSAVTHTPMTRNSAAATKSQPRFQKWLGSSPYGLGWFSYTPIGEGKLSLTLKASRMSEPLTYSPVLHVVSSSVDSELRMNGGET